MRVCLFGGTFDPPHIGHLLIAQTVCEAENFDTILFVPANKQLQKKVVTDKKKRIKMLELAIKDNPNFELSDIEINSYMVTLPVWEYIDRKNLYI